MYKQLTSEQRYTISVLLQRKCSKKSIAEAIGVHPSTITRELKRNSSQRGVYKWDWPQKHADKRRRRLHRPVLTVAVKEILEDEEDYIQ